MNWYRINSQVGANGETDIFIFDEIGIWGIGADKLINEVQRLQPKSINLHLNSPGGAITDGLAIFNYLRAHSAKVTVYVDSLAASIAGVIAMAGDEIVMAEASMFHMHLPGIAGYVHEKVDGLEELAANLRQWDVVIRGIYQRRTGASAEQLEEWMSGETYFTPAEALEHGLIDRVEDKVRMVACAAQWDGERYPEVKAAQAKNNFNGGHHVGGQPQPNQNQKENTDMSKELESRIATLEAEAKLSASTITDLNAQVDAAPAQIEAAKTEGETTALAAEKSRRESIVALSDQYNKDGDLDALALTAISDGKTADEFKDDVLEAVSKRPTTQRAETGGSEGGASAESDVDTLRASLEKETDPVARGAIAKKLRDARNK